MSEEKKTSIRDAYRAYVKNPELNETKLLEVLNNYKNTWLDERKSQHDPKWREYASFYAGNQFVRELSSNQRYRVRVRENHTNNTLARMISIFTQNLPIVRVFPGDGGSDIDVRNAENTESYGKYFWRVKKLELKVMKNLRYACIFGNAFTFPFWNPDLGERVLMNEDETESGEAEERFYQGDIQVDVDDPFRILLRPGVDELDDMYDFIRSVPANRQSLESKYGEIQAESVQALNAYSGAVRSDSDMVLQNHYYHKPTHWFEEGLYACWVGSKILHVRPASKCEQKLPLIHLPFDKPPMKFYGVSSIEQIMDLQEQLNRAAGMIIEARNLVARPRAIVSHEAQVPGQSLSDRPGDILRYKLAGGPPKFEVPSFQFAEMQAHKGDLRTALQDVMGITSASRGVIPAATKTALALQLVLEQDRSQYLPFIKTFYQSIQDMMEKVFEIAAENLSEDDPRVIKVEGSSGGSRTFHGGMVPSPLDVYLEDTNPLGWTAGARAEQIMTLVDKQVVTDKNQVLEMLKITNTDPAYRHLNLNKKTAERENEDFRRGIPLDIGPEDDDAIHMDTHTAPVASYDFRELPKAVQDAFLMHISQHKQRLESLKQPPGPQPGAIRQGGVNPEQAQAAVSPPDEAQLMAGLLQK